MNAAKLIFCRGSKTRLWKRTHESSANRSIPDIISITSFASSGVMAEFLTIAHNLGQYPMMRSPFRGN